MAGADGVAAARLTIFHLAKFTLVDPGLNGPRLERRDDAESFSETDPAKIETILGWIEAARPAPAPASLDARWGLVFFGIEGERVREIYLDANGARGQIDGAPVAFASDSLILNLRAAYGEDFILS